MLKESTVKIFNYVKEHEGENITARDIAEALDLSSNSANGSINSFVRKELMERVSAEVELEDGTHKSINFIKLTDAGKEFDPEAENTKKAE